MHPTSPERGSGTFARRSFWRRAPLLALAAVFLPGNGGLELDRLLRDFGIVAFGAELGQETDGRLHKWDRPLRVYLDIRAGEPDLYRMLTTRHLDDLADLTGLPIALVAEPADANVFIVFDRDADLRASAGEHARDGPEKDIVLRQAFCFGQFWYDKRNGGILRAVIGIPSDRAASEGMLPHCIVEETTQMLGLPNDADDVYPSIFNDKSILDYLGEHDRALVRLLYDPRLPVGIGQDEALARARPILREHGY